MKFTSVSIRNFLTIEEATLRLDDRGLVLVEGVNDDDTSAESNGAGKSSLFDAICWALYGVTARGLTGDAVINNVALKNCQVAVNLVDGDVEYSIARFRKDSVHKNQVQLWVRPDPGAEYEDHTKGTDKLTQAEIEKAIGCSFDVFCAAIYARQGKMPDLPGMTDKALKVLIEEAAGSTVLDAGHQIALKRLNALKVRESSRTMEVSLAQRSYDEHCVRVEDLIKGSELWIAEKEVRLEEDKKTLLALHKDYKALKDLYPEGVVSGLKLNEAAIVAKIDGVKAETEKAERLKTVVAERDKAVSAAILNLDLACTLVNKLTGELDAVDKQVGKPCSECGKPYCEHDIAGARERLAKKLLEAQDDKTAKKLLVVSAKEALAASENAFLDFRATMTDLSKELAQLKSVREELAKLAELNANVEQAKVEVQKHAALMKERAAKTNPYDMMIASAEGQMFRLKDELEAKKDHLLVCQKEIEIATAVVEVFGPKGVRAEILDDVTPFLNDRTAIYLSTLSDGNLEANWTTLVRSAKGELRENFSIEVKNLKGGDSFEAISGGESRKVRIATALALQDLVARRAAKPIDLFIGDEIDDALDSAGRERLTVLLNEKAKERGSVFVISHSDLRDWISQVVVVRKSAKGASKIEELVV